MKKEFRIQSKGTRPTASWKVTKLKKTFLNGIRVISRKPYQLRKKTD